MAVGIIMKESTLCIRCRMKKAKENKIRCCECQSKLTTNNVKWEYIKCYS